jgi:peptide deformylase
MRLRLIGDEVLKSPSDKVTTFDKKLIKLSKSMHKFMKKERGIGLAAPQIGKSIQLVVINIDNKPLTIVNPVINSYLGENVILSEGCLSIPGKVLPISRPEGVNIGYKDELGNNHNLEAHGWLSRCIQHELGHIGIGSTYLMTDMPNPLLLY